MRSRFLVSCRTSSWRVGGNLHEFFSREHRSWIWCMHQIHFSVVRQFFLPRMVQQAARLLYNVVSRHTGGVQLSRTFILQLCDCRALLHNGPYVSCTTVLLSQAFIHYTHNRIAKCFIPIVNAKSHVHFFSVMFSTIHFSVRKIYFSTGHFNTLK